MADARYPTGHGTKLNEQPIPPTNTIRIPQIAGMSVCVCVGVIQGSKKEKKEKTRRETEKRPKIPAICIVGGWFR